MSKRLTQEEFEAKFNSIYHHRFKVIGKYKTARTPITVECNFCEHRVDRIPNHLDSGTLKCPRCESNQSTIGVLVGINDIHTTDPDVGNLLSNSIDGYNYRINTGTQLEFTCPNCGKHKFMLPSNVKSRGMSCDYCSDGVSYPNKFIRNILDLLGIEFEPEYMVNINGKRCFYDVFFKINNKPFCIEMDGGLGHGHKNNKSRTIEEQLFIDSIKNDYAINNGITLIRIDCNYGDINNRYEYIKKNILQSDLLKYLHITDEIFQKADSLSVNSNTVLFSKLWNNGIHSYHELKNKLNVRTNATIRNYAKCCSDLGLIQESYDDFLNTTDEKRLYQKTPRHVQPILCVQTGEVFISMSDARRKMSISHLDRFFSGEYSYCGKLPDGTRLTWEKISKEQYYKFKQ